MQAWEQFLKVQEAQLGAETVNKWLRSLKVLHFDACNLYVEAADSIYALWFEEHIRPHLRKTFFNNNHRLIKVHLSIAHDTPPAPPKTKDKQKPAPFTLCFDTLDPKATFENFVAPENSMAATFFQQLKKEQLGSFNPIYLYGPPGVGKTHLLMAAAHVLKKQGCNVLYVKAETFTEHVISAIRNSAMQEFRKAYRHVDVLILDDVHLFARRSATQEEFFHTFNTLHGLGRQIFLSAQVPPENLEEIEPRLISRFEWGLTLQLEKLEAAGLSQVLRRQLEALKFPLTAHLMQLLLDRLGNNSILLRQAALALVQRCRFTKTAAQALTPDSVRTILEDFLEEEKRLALNPQKILSAVAAYYGVKVTDILGKSQTKECSVPRQVAMHLCRHKLGLPYLKIGSLFSRDHSTVMTAVKHVEKKVSEQDPEMGGALVSIEKDLQ